MKRRNEYPHNKKQVIDTIFENYKSTRYYKVREEIIQLFGNENTIQ